MSVWRNLVESIRNGGVEVIDLTAPLSPQTPVLRLPEPFGNTVPFTLKEISRYDDRGPAWYWNDISTGKYGLTQLRNLDRLPVTGAVVVAPPLPIVGGSGSPVRVLALVER
ncbi:hypothetical protein SAMN05216275_106111 [Streptosporangium canum]|uniref:Cyclase n=1 Tax=Streptosporangium canum TaxID=324952 RepID=A0A1I3N4U7_9ACTN|nr:hypothetical protein [Streptosporangium canum]SFJ04202.1 hypothetical protein SAMN05216275_106111 [Streptosporangium canum]